MADGRGVDITVFGGALDWNVGDWTISDRFNVLSGDAPTNALFTGANPQTLSSFITDTYGATATGTGTFVNGGGTVSPVAPSRLAICGRNTQITAENTTPTPRPSTMPVSYTHLDVYKRQPLKKKSRLSGPQNR